LAIGIKIFAISVGNPIEFLQK